MTTNDGRISDTDELRAAYRAPSQYVLDKAIDHVDDGVRDFISRSPMFVFATSDGSGLDASPRGGTAGFVQVLDERHIAFGDLSGNNRIDSYRNVVASPEVGLLFFVPGLDETLRLNGRASVVTSDEVRERCAIDGRVPKVAIVVGVTECFVHCGKALRRGGVWDASTWPAADERPSPAAMLTTHMGLDIDPSVLEADLESSYGATMWEPGGA